MSKRNSARFTSSQRRILTIMGLITSILCLVLGFNLYDAYQLWKTPLGPGLDMPSPTPGTPLPALTAVENTRETTDTATNIPSQVNGANNGEIIVEQIYTAGSDSAAPLSNTIVRTTPLCNGPATMTILAIGTDARSGTYTYGLADMIRIVRVDFITPRVSVLSFPRDLWVEIPGIEPYAGVTHERLNQAYLYGNPGFDYYDGPGEGPGLLARTLALNFGVQPDHYVAINMRVFVKIVDALGGIDVYLPHAVDGRMADQTGRTDLLFTRGTHHLYGERALMLGRLRLEGVFARTEQQNYVLCGLRDTLLSPSSVTKIPALIEAFEDSVQTDLTPEQISQLTCLAPYLKDQNLIFTGFPEEMFEGTRIYDPVFKGRVFIWAADYDLMRDYIIRFNNGSWPTLPLAAGLTPEPDDNPGFVCPKPPEEE
ncbi:MAG: LCP family protein [Anaerolineales bacterium]|nr:LCP family protein [Anaerolineales bacterium]